MEVLAPEIKAVVPGRSSHYVQLRIAVSGRLQRGPSGEEGQGQHL